jgi:hypothetical protein
LIIALVIIGVLLLIGITALVTVLLVGGRSSTDAAASVSTPTATPTATPSPTASPAPPATKAAPAPSSPPDTTLAISKFTTGSTSVTCDSSGTKQLSFSWSSANGSNVYFGVDTADASAGFLFSDLPATGTDADFPYPVTFHCSDGSKTYTLTVVATGSKVSKSVVVTSK